MQCLLCEHPGESQYAGERFSHYQFTRSHPRQVEVAGEQMILGRTADTDIQLEHSQVSRKHAQIWRDGMGRFHVKDLASRNGTFVNGSPITDQVLTHGDQIGIGDFVITFQGPGLPPTRHQTRIVLDGKNVGKISTMRELVSPRIDAKHLTTLNEFSQTLVTTPAAADRLAAICALMVGEHFRGQWAVIVRLDSDSTEDNPQLLCDALGAASGSEHHLSRSVLRRVRETGEAVLARNVGLPDASQMNIEASISPEIMALSAVACPLEVRENGLDVLYVMLPPGVGGPEWLALVSLAIKQLQQADSLWASRKQAEQIVVMEMELSRAHQIQMKLVPQNPQFDGLDLAIGYVPCKYIGGDYVDALKLTDGRTLLTVADVCGKGLAAALISSSLHTMVHASVSAGLGLTQLMTNMNQYLVETLPPEAYVTMIAVAMDAATGDIEIVNAGHPDPFAILPGKEVRQLTVEGGFPLGMEPGNLTSNFHKLEPGELLALYSDGLSELHLPEGTMLEAEGLGLALKTIYSSPQTNALAVSDQLFAQLNSLLAGKPATDDWAYLLARRN